MKSNKLILGAKYMEKLKKFILCGIILIIALNIVACNKPKEEIKVTELTGKINIWVTKENKPVLEYEAGLFTEKHPKVKINIVNQDSSEIEKSYADAKQNKGKLPDIITLNDCSISKFINKYKNELMEVSVISGFKKGQFIAKQINNVSVKNNVYALPWYVNPTVAVYREDILNASKLKAEDIKTWEQFSDAGKNLSASGGKGMLSLSSFKSGVLYNAGINQLGINYFNENGKLDLLDKTNVKPAAAFYNMYQSKIFYDDSKDGGELSAFANGNIAAMICDINMLNSIEKNYPSLKGKLNVEKLPAFEEGGSRGAVSYGSNLTALKGTVNNKAAIDFMKFLTMDSGLAVNEYKKFGLVASNSALWENKYYSKKSVFYNNQKLGEIAVDDVENLKEYKYSDDYEAINASMLSSLVDSAVNNKSLNDSILNLEKAYGNSGVLQK